MNYQLLKQELMDIENMLYGYAFAFFGSSIFMEASRAAILAMVGALFAGFGGWLWKYKIEPTLTKKEDDETKENKGDE